MNWSNWILMLIFLLETQLADPKPKGLADPWDWQNSPANFPVFNTFQSRPAQTRVPEFFSPWSNVTGLVGSTAELPCSVKNLGKFYTVSWIRARDVTVLSVGQLAFSSDNRFSVAQVTPTESFISEWSLQIRNVSKHDQGVYECQINTDPKINKKVYLQIEDRPLIIDRQDDSPYVRETTSVSSYLQQGELLYNNKHSFQGAVVEVAGPSVQYVSEGEPAGLDCSLTSEGRTVAGSLSWERDGVALSARVRPGLSMETERLGGRSRARLFFDAVRQTDSGKYSCVSDAAATQSVHLVVGKGVFDKPSELLSMSSRPCLSASLLLLTILI